MNANIIRHLQTPTAKLRLTSSLILLVAGLHAPISAARECRAEWWPKRWHNDAWGCVYLYNNGGVISGRYTTFHGVTGTFTNGNFITSDDCVVRGNWTENTGKSGSFEWTMEDENFFQGNYTHSSDSERHPFGNTKPIGPSPCPEY